MNISIYFAAALITAFIALYIKQTRPDFSLCVTLGGIALVFSGIIPRLAALVNDIYTFASLDNIETSYITPLMKIIGISYIAQISADICKDAGESALSNHVETLGKISIAFIALPIVEDVFSLIISLLE